MAGIESEASSFRRSPEFEPQLAPIDFTRADHRALGHSALDAAGVAEPQTEVSVDTAHDLGNTALKSY